MNNYMCDSISQMGSAGTGPFWPKLQKSIDVCTDASDVCVEADCCGYITTFQSNNAL